MDERPSAVREHFRHAFRWRGGGRQRSGYGKRRLLQSPFPLPFDVSLLRFAVGSTIPPHVDPASAGRHDRCNIAIKRARQGGEFVCAAPIFATERIKRFRPDACEHSVTRVERGARYVLSIGWIRRSGAADRPPSA